MKLALGKTCTVERDGHRYVVLVRGRPVTMATSGPDLLRKLSCSYAQAMLGVPALTSEQEAAVEMLPDLENEDTPLMLPP
jgi:hypothetical protein